MAETKAAAELAFDAFVESYTPKYEKAADCLGKDRDTLLAFYDFPAEHWKHLRTTDEIDKRFLRGRGILRCAGDLVAKCGAPAESAAGRSYSCLAGLRRPRAFLFGERGRQASTKCS